MKNRATKFISLALCAVVLFAAVWVWPLGTSLRCVFLKLPARPLTCKDNLKKKIARLKPHRKTSIL